MLPIGVIPERGDVWLYGQTHVASMVSVCHIQHLLHDVIRKPVPHHHQQGRVRTAKYNLS